MIIAIKEIEDVLKEIFKNSSIQFINSVYEKSSNGYKLVIDLKNIFLDKKNIIYTKLLFEVDDNKIYLQPNDNKEYNFKYLYDINCNYKMHIFETKNEFKTKFISIINGFEFGENIKILSEFIKSPSSLINNWFFDNGVKNISVYDVKLDERYKIIPCKSLFFNFIINLNNQLDINFSLKKESNNNYIFNFKIYDDTFQEETTNLFNMVEIIGETLKNKYI